MRLAWWAVGTFIVAACTAAAPEQRRASSSREPDGAAPDLATIVEAGVDSRPDPEASLGVLAFRPEEIYSGFDGQHTFKAPIAVYDAADDLQVTVDPSAATIARMTLENIPPGQSDTGKYFFVTPKKAGSIELVATSRGASTTATLVVAAYGPTRWAAGKKRYETAGTNGEPPCAQCHTNGAAIDHSPAALAGVSDANIALVITSGISPAGYPITVDHPSEHRWTVTDDEREGLITYLRGLEPRGFGPR
ncbi:MAG TPA: hypothetical protein VM925_07645 [Labilithrix sp.]|jgi:mono/diheme cytochrome c family protein|nr:hypothetical protein [Labilithrix sp.]